MREDFYLFENKINKKHILGEIYVCVFEEDAGDGPTKYMHKGLDPFCVVVFMRIQFEKDLYSRLMNIKRI